jgi:hypothetical protein
VQLAALPSEELRQLRALDERAIVLTERRDAVHGGLERLSAPRQRRFGRSGDPHVVERTRLTSTLAGYEIQLERVLTERSSLARQLGDIEAIGRERDSLTSAINATRREHSELLDVLVEQDIVARPAWVRDVLGERPDRPSAAERWDRAARTLARYRIEYAIPAGAGDPLGAEPAGGEQRRDYDRAQQAREELGREASGHQLDLS